MNAKQLAAELRDMKERGIASGRGYLWELTDEKPEEVDIILAALEAYEQLSAIERHIAKHLSHEVAFITAPGSQKFRMFVKMGYAEPARVFDGNSIAELLKFAPAHPEREAWTCKQCGANTNRCANDLCFRCNEIISRGALTPEKFEEKLYKEPEAKDGE